MMHEEKWKRNARKSRKRSKRGLKQWNVRRRRSMRQIEIESEKGHNVRRKRGPRPLGKESIPDALSDVPGDSPDISNSLRHVRSSSSTRLPCSMHMPLHFVVLENSFIIKPV